MMPKTLQTSISLTMEELFKNKYRIPSARASWWNYANPGAYFITICTDQRQHYFGEIHHQKMVLSPCGIIADVLWYEIRHHFPHVTLGAFVVMPNHVHGVLILAPNDDADRADRAPVETLHATSLPPNAPPNAPPPNEKNEQMAAISPAAGSVSTIVRSYKSAVTRHAHRLGHAFAWQTRFHDHIIRNEEEYHRISRYILTNPQRWKEDKFFYSE